MTQEQLREILDKHNKWVNHEMDGERADLSGANLRWLNLSGVNLREANLRDADFSYSDLRWANLSGANLIGVDLCGVDLRGANLCYANLHGADLSGTNLRGSNLIDADLTGSTLHYSNLTDANLRGANLRDANLAGATYAGTALNLQCPVEGSFIAWKKLAGGSIAKLLIPADAKRSSATTRKCRASKAVVLAIYNKGGEEVSEGKSEYDHDFIYQVSETVYPDKWDESRWEECSNGIHFFVTREEAEEY